MKKIKYSRIFILGVIIYILFKIITILIGLNTQVLTLKNDYYSMKIKTKALIIRDEYLVKSNTKGTLNLLVDENKKVQKSQKIAMVYKNFNDDLNKEKNKLQEEIKILEKDKNPLKSGILLMKKDQLKILDEKIKSNVSNYYSNMSGIISYKYDNNEKRYNTNNLLNIEKKDIEESNNDYMTITNNKVIDEDDIIARIINNNELYLAFISNDNKLFNQGDSVKIGIKNDIIDGEIYKKYKKNDYFVVIIKISQQNIGIYDTRQEEFDIIYRQLEAVRIPKESIIEQNDKKSVYIINEENNKPKLVEIKGISFEDDTYIYVDFRKNERLGINTIKLHDRIILRPNFINKKVKKFN